MSVQVEDALPQAPEPEHTAVVRAVHELEAAQARVERDADRVKESMRAALVLELLPVLDNLDRAIAAADASGQGELFAGVELVRTQFERVLMSYGVERMETVGHPFDATLHEAIGLMAVDDPHHRGLVIKEALAGYRFGGKLLRPAHVFVGVIRQH